MVVIYELSKCMHDVYHDVCSLWILNVDDIYVLVNTMSFTLKIKSFFIQYLNMLLPLIDSLHGLHKILCCIHHIGLQDTAGYPH